MLYPETRKALEGIEKYIHMDKICLYTIMKVIQDSENGRCFFIKEMGLIQKKNRRRLSRLRNISTSILFYDKRKKSRNYT